MHKGCPRGGREFLFLALMISGESTQKLCRCRGGNRHETVGAVYKTAACIDTGGHDFFDGKIIKANGSSHDIHDGIHCPDFMECYLIRGTVVDFPLGNAKFSKIAVLRSFTPFDREESSITLRISAQAR